MNSLARSSVHEFPVALPGAEHFVSVPDGEYVAAFIGSEGFRFLGRRPKVAMWFRLEDSNELIASYYNVLQLDSMMTKERVRSPQFTVGWRGRLVRDLATLFPDDYSPASLPIEIPEINGRVNVMARAVTKDGHGKIRPEGFRNSVVDSIEGWSK